MIEFGINSNITHGDVKIHVLNYLTEKYDVILNVLKNFLIFIGPDALTIEMICDKLNRP